MQLLLIGVAQFYLPLPLVWVMCPGSSELRKETFHFLPLGRGFLLGLKLNSLLPADIKAGAVMTIFEFAMNSTVPGAKWLPWIYRCWNEKFYHQPQFLHNLISSISTLNSFFKVSQETLFLLNVKNKEDKLISPVGKAVSWESFLMRQYNQEVKNTGSRGSRPGFKSSSSIYWLCDLGKGT